MTDDDTMKLDTSRDILTWAMRNSVSPGADATAEYLASCVRRTNAINKLCDKYERIELALRVLGIVEWHSGDYVGLDISDVVMGYICQRILDAANK